MNKAEKREEIKKLSTALGMSFGLLFWVWTSSLIIGLITVIFTYLIIIKLSKKKK